VKIIFVPLRILRSAAVLSDSVGLGADAGAQLIEERSRGVATVMRGGGLRGGTGTENGSGIKSDGGGRGW